MDEFSDSINHTTATHLVRAFGGRARDVLLTKNKNGDKMHRLLISGFPYIEAEVIYSVRSEMAVRAEDIIARRTRLAFLNRFALIFHH
jgi:glycerol-3-phosphate dehydrogenase